MAIKIYEQFAPFANPADGDYPHGSFKNDSIPGAEDGTPLDAVWANDYAGTDAELFAQAGIVPNGNPDTVGNSQRVDALKKIHGVYGTVASLAAGAHPIGAYVTIKDRALGEFLVQSGGAPNGRDIIDAGNGNTAVYTQKTVLYVKHLLNQGETDSSAAANAACALSPVSGGIVSFEDIGETNINTQVLVKKHTFIDLANATVSSTLDDVIFYFNKNGLNSGLPSYHGGDGGLNYWCDNRTGISNGRLYGKVTAPFLTNQYLAASDRVIGFTMQNVSCSYTNALQLNGESWLADIRSVKGYNIIGDFFLHQLNPWGDWEESIGVPISQGNGPNNANYFDCWVENLVSDTAPSCGWNIQSGSAVIFGGYAEALHTCFKGAGIKLEGLTIGSRNYAGTIFKVDREGTIQVSGGNLAIANTTSTTVFDVVVPCNIEWNDVSTTIPFIGNSSYFLKSIAEVRLSINGGKFDKAATNLDTWALFNLQYDGVTTFGALTELIIDGAKFKSAAGKWINFVSGASNGPITGATINGNLFNRCDNFNGIANSTINSNTFDGGNSTGAIQGSVTNSIVNDNNFINNSPAISFDATTKAAGNKGWAGTQKRGTLVANGDGTNRSFRINHGLPNGVNIINYSFTPVSFDAANLSNFFVQHGNGYLDIIFNTAPPVGTGNVNFKWFVES